MRTNQNINLAFSQFFHDAGTVFGTTSPTQIIHFTRKILQSFTESLKVLISQYGSRDKYRHLFVVRHSLKSSTHCYFRFSKTNIPAHQTVHRTFAFHISLYILSCLQLVGSILINKTGLQLMLQKAVGSIAEALLLLSLRV